MSIIKSGKVTITTEEILVEQFIFDSREINARNLSLQEALRWAVKRCEEELNKEIEHYETSCHSPKRG